MSKPDDGSSPSNTRSDLADEQITSEPMTKEQGDRIIGLLERIARNGERAANAAVGSRGPWEFTVAVSPYLAKVIRDGK